MKKVGLLCAVSLVLMIPSAPVGATTPADQPSPFNSNEGSFNEDGLRIILPISGSDGSKTETTVDHPLLVRLQLDDFWRSGEASTEEPAGYDPSIPEAGTLEIDADADGVYETIEQNTFVNMPSSYASISRTFTIPGFEASDSPYRVRARYTTPAGRRVLAEQLVYVESNYGVSVDAGATFTNSNSVELTIVPPPGAVAARISNDAGFQQLQRIDVAPGPNSVSWTLSTAGAGKYTRNVYVRFVGSQGDATYSDDIVLDSTPPSITRASASVLKANHSARSAGNQVAKRVRFHLAARDNRSGLAQVQVAPRKAVKAAVTKGFHRAFTVRVKAPGHAFVRVSDGAGNWTRWKRVALRTARH